jgi:hypothetical protein
MPRVTAILLLHVLATGAWAAESFDPASLQDELAAAADGLEPKVLALALKATARAWGQGLDRRKILTVIDYSLPSTRKRLWVIDLAQKKVLFHELVAHGRGSGENRATRFSNRARSLESSLGLFETLGTYQGKHGYSLKLKGLEAGINDKAIERAIVIHGAWYVSAAFARQHGRLGRSWGCPALDQAIAKDVIDTLKGGSLLFVYYPDPEWIRESDYLETGT